MQAPSMSTPTPRCTHAPLKTQNNIFETTAPVEKAMQPLGRVIRHTAPQRRIPIAPPRRRHGLLATHQLHATLPQNLTVAEHLVQPGALQGALLAWALTQQQPGSTSHWLPPAIPILCPGDPPWLNSQQRPKHCTPTQASGLALTAAARNITSIAACSFDTVPWQDSPGWRSGQSHARPG